MSYSTCWHVPDGPPGLACIETKINVLVMGVIALIQNPDVLKNLTADDHTSSAHPIHLAGVSRYGRCNHPPAENAACQSKTDTCLKLAKSARKSERGTLWRTIRI